MKKPIVVIVEQMNRKLKADAWFINDTDYFDGERAICIVFLDEKKEYQIAIKL
jgi:hypothetical protein